MTTYIFIRTRVIKQKAVFSEVFPEIFRNCSPKFLNEELEHIHNSISKLQYPESVIHRA